MTEIFQTYTKENENLYNLFKDTDMVKYVSVKGLKCFSHGVRKQNLKRNSGWKKLWEKEGVKNAAKYLDTKNWVAIARHKSD